MRVSKITISCLHLKHVNLPSYDVMGDCNQNVINGSCDDALPLLIWVRFSKTRQSATPSSSPSPTATTSNPHRSTSKAPNQATAVTRDAHPRCLIFHFTYHFHLCMFVCLRVCVVFSLDIVSLGFCLVQFSLFSMTRLGNTQKVVISRHRLLINMINGVKLSYY